MTKPKSYGVRGCYVCGPAASMHLCDKCRRAGQDHLKRRREGARNWHLWSWLCSRARAFERKRWRKVDRIAELRAMTRELERIQRKLTGEELTEKKRKEKE